MERHGGNIYDKDIRIDFSVNVSPFGMTEAVRQAAILGVEESVRYPDPAQGRLRAALAAHHGMPAERIVAGNGAAELIYAVCAAFRPGKALVCGPTFGEYEAAVCAFGGQAVRFTACREEGYRMTERLLAEVERQEGLDMVFLCNPNNPTGRLADPALLRDLAYLCRGRGILLIVDECFLEMTEPGEGASCLDLQAQCPGILILRAFTKLYAMPGLRLGYLLTADVQTADRVRGVLPPWNVSWPAQRAGLAALGEQEKTRRTVEALLAERKWLGEELAGLGLSVWPSDTTFLLFEGPKDLQERCLADGIYIRDGASFPGLSAGTWRIGVRRREENLELLRTIETAKERHRWQK